jgi:hypothetical protein
MSHDSTGRIWDPPTVSTDPKPRFAWSRATTRLKCTHPVDGEAECWISEGQPYCQSISPNTGHLRHDQKCAAHAELPVDDAQLKAFDDQQEREAIQSEERIEMRSQQRFARSMGRGDLRRNVQRFLAGHDVDARQRQTGETS